MANAYYSAIQAFQTKIEKYVKDIFKEYGNELQLSFGGYNLLAHNKNCLESSTAFGYIIEEFLVSKLEIYSKSHTGNEYKIQRTDGSTTISSYDCFSLLKNIKVLVNIKADKKNNNAIAAINSLCNDYYIQNPDEVKAYLTLKISYSIKKSHKDGERKIFIDKINSFFLEEIDFSKGHKQDHRNWSEKEYKSESGRLQVSESFRREHKLEKNKVSYENTKKMLKHIASR